MCCALRPQIARQQQQLLQQQHKINLLQQQIQVRPVDVCVCVCVSIRVCRHVYVSFKVFARCVLMCVCMAHKGNFVIVIVAAFLCSAISILVGLNQR